MNLWQRIHLKIWGWYRDGDKTYTRCPTHGVTEAYVHGHYEKIGCVKCLQEHLGKPEAAAP